MFETLINYYNISNENFYVEILMCNTISLKKLI